MSIAPLLQTHDVVRNFGSLLAVNRVSLALKEGELRSIIGPSGAGKTTLFRLIAGEMAPSAGRIVFRGRDITGLPQHTVARMGIAKSYLPPMRSSDTASRGCRRNAGSFRT